MGRGGESSKLKVQMKLQRPPTQRHIPGSGLKGPGGPSPGLCRSAMPWGSIDDATGLGLNRRRPVDCCALVSDPEVGSSGGRQRAVRWPDYRGDLVHHGPFPPGDQSTNAAPRGTQTDASPPEEGCGKSSVHTHTTWEYQKRGFPTTPARLGASRAARADTPVQTPSHPWRNQTNTPQHRATVRRRSLLLFCQMLVTRCCSALARVSLPCLSGSRPCSGLIQSAARE